MCFLPCRASGVAVLYCSLACFRAMALLRISCCLCISTGSGWAVFQRWTIIHIFRLKRLKHSKPTRDQVEWNLLLHTHSWNDVLGVSVSSDNTTVIHNVSIITVCPTLSRKNTIIHSTHLITLWRLRGSMLQVAHSLLWNQFSLYYLILFQPFSSRKQAVTDARGKKIL